jgi:hypothetical protein
MTVTHCFVAIKDYGMGSKHVILDLIHPETQAGIYGKKTLAEQTAKHGPVTIMTLAEYDVIHENDWRIAPDPIPMHHYTHALEVLPPENWVQEGGNSSFKIMEYWSGQMTSIYAKVDGAYYHLVDKASLTHGEIIAMCRATKAKEPQ